MVLFAQMTYLNAYSQMIISQLQCLIRLILHPSCKRNIYNNIKSWPVLSRKPIFRCFYKDISPHRQQGVSSWTSVCFYHHQFGTRAWRCEKAGSWKPRIMPNSGLSLFVVWNLRFNQLIKHIFNIFFVICCW